MEFKYTKAITHSTLFHSDDVFATALVKLLNPDIEVRRTLKPPTDVPEDTLIFDIGGGKYDHHTPETKEYREDGITPYCAFGKLWRDFGHLLVSDKTWNDIDRDLVAPIDSHDNLGTPGIISAVISMYNPNWNESRDTQDAKFWEAVEFAKGILEKYIKRDKANVAAQNIVATAVEESSENVLVFDLYVPWKECLPKDDTPWIAVYPSARGGFCIETISSVKFPLPEAWSKELPKDMTFCHLSRFLAACTTKEAAVRYAHEAAKQYITY